MNFVRKMAVLLLIVLIALTNGIAFAAPVIENQTDLVINQTIALSAGDGATFKLVEGGDIATLNNNMLRALASGEVTVEATQAGETVSKTFTIAQSVRLCGAVAETEFPGPVCVWIDFNKSTGEIAHIEISGIGNPTVLEAYGEGFSALDETKNEFLNLTAKDVLENEAFTGVLAEAVKDACDHFLNPAAFEIRPYQSMMVDRYLANNPYFAQGNQDMMVETFVLASYPDKACTVVKDDVLYDGKVRWPAGLVSSVFENGDAKYEVSHHAVKANVPGIALIQYRNGDSVVNEAVEIYENFTLYPEKLTGSDAYGKVVGFPADLKADLLTYRVLGDKAMNFPGGTVGSTVIDVTFDRNARKIADVRIVAHSDSPYLSNPWEYNGGFIATGDMLHNIAAFANKFINKEVDSHVSSYVLSNAKESIVGGTVVDGGIDMVVTGATRTPNAIIYAVNAAIDQFVNDNK